MYNFNGQLFDENLNPVGGTLTPGQVQQGSNTVLQLQDMKDMQVYQTTPEANLDNLYMKAKKDGAKELSGGLDIKPPSALRQMIDMAGGLLIGYFAAKSGGASGTGALLVGLTAAASNHDSDQKLIDRAKIARKMFSEGGYTEDALYNFYRTGDDSGLKAETSSIAADRRQGITEQGVTARQQTGINAQKERQASQQQFQAGEDDKRLTVQQQIANAKLKAMDSGNADPSGKFTITGNYTKDHEANIPLQDFLSNYRKANADLHKAQQADARIDAVNTNTPIGQVAAAYQFLTVEAPSISNTVATASGVSDEAVNGWSDKINQIIQNRIQQGGKFTPEEINEMKNAAHSETAAMKKLSIDAANSLAQGYNMNDLKTATAVSAATGVPISELRAAQEQSEVNNSNTVTYTTDDGQSHTVNKSDANLMKDPKTGQLYVVIDGKGYPVQ
ncbi:hypothetical protein [Klebsiella variicola]|uniref:hypothetical protein n=1 Tax=Klebsiella variicola TaxID=244366 RepID=UPI003CFEAECB